MLTQVLKVVSDIWKSGANIYLDPKDNRMGITRQNLIPTEVMRAAEQHFQEIHTWFQSWKNESVEEITMLKILYQFCGWQHNQKLNEWLLDDEESLQLFYDWTIILAENGWTDIYEDYRPFQNDKLDAMARKLYERAVMYAKRGVEE
ncbi:hypothetical protein P4G85_28975 [Bacillus cereus]|uniref:Uncharacterized protein n=1 Tax=Bacillus cereus VD154 TaxID=1053238 RepID=A0A9W5KXA9_BACCE|nr:MULTISPECIES: hypothetical protein [Bacillus cereus group]MEB8731232.1 hypothetical protein [Bacillus cereus]EEM44070.1 hypothetical protein bthur0005_62420 [Bacillus thuringiensis serovar pakistani str. T13001]EJR71993.1 hypothetical protein IK5_02891 [Bacillus cereus VD154]MEB8752268.1 hypothetical protein [Bacillus cereus]MEB8759686.1 hypothetical protein [Bacillus cereus]